MALNLSKEERNRFEVDLAAAEPYEYDAPEANTLDGEIDFKRYCATMAKRFLEQDDVV